MIMHEAYVVPSITYEDKLRQSAVKPCEHYQDGKLVNN